MQNEINLNKPALLVVDIQNGFIEESELPVPGGKEIIPIINRLMPLFPVVVASQDWHPPEHGSFHIHHPGAKPYDIGRLGGKPQVLFLKGQTLSSKLAWLIFPFSGELGLMRNDLLSLEMITPSWSWLGRESHLFLILNPRFTPRAENAKRQDRALVDD